MKKILLISTICAICTLAQSQTWNLTGNAGTTPGTNFIGTTDSKALYLKTNSNTRIVVTSAGKVGIGSTAPVAKLQVEGLANASEVFRISNDKNTTKDSIMVMTSKGYVGIGTATPSAKLHVTGDIKQEGVGISFYELGSPTLRAHSITHIHSLGSDANNALMFNVSNGVGVTSQKMIINGAGNVGIGTSSPGYKLEVTGGDARINGVVIGGGSGINNNSNIAIGDSALKSNANEPNIAIGNFALYSNTGGYDNIAFGFGSLFDNTTGGSNVAIGVEALSNNSIADNNLAMGFHSLYSNTEGSENVGIGQWSLYSNILGAANLGMGVHALYFNQNGGFNTAIGYHADVSVGNFLNASAVGSSALVNSGNKVRIGNTNVTVVESQAGSWTTSDGRFKYDVREEVKGLNFIKLLRPVNYNFDIMKFENHLMQNFSDSIKAERLKGREDGIKKATEMRQTGFIAQEVLEAAKKSGYDFNGIHIPENPTDNYSLSYEKLVVPLVKAVQELSQQNEQLKNKVEQLEVLLTRDNLNDGAVKLKSSDSQEDILLGQNIPNPFDNSTIIPFRIPKNCNSASILITETSSGKLVTVVPVSCRETHLMIEAGKLASGTYSYSLYIDGRLTDSKQMVISK